MKVINRILLVVAFIYLNACIIELPETLVPFNPVIEQTNIIIDRTNECVLEFKCYAGESDTGYFILVLSSITNFSNHNIVCELPQIEIYDSDYLFIPTEFKESENSNIYFPSRSAFEKINNVHISGKDSATFRIMFNQKTKSANYKQKLDKLNADIAVTNIILINHKNEKIILRDIFFETYY